MAKQKQQAAQQLEQQADANLDELEANQQGQEPNISSDEPRGLAVGYANAEAEIFLSILRGLRIQVPDGEHPSATADKAIKLHQELMIKARQVGIIA